MHFMSHCLRVDLSGAIETFCTHILARHSCRTLRKLLPRIADKSPRLPILKVNYYVFESVRIHKSVFE